MALSDRSACSSRSIAARSAHHAAPEVLGEGRFLGRDDLLLDRDRLPFEPGAAPVPRRPLELHAGEPVAVEVVAQRIEPGTAEARAAERAQPGPVAATDFLACAVERLPAAGEMRVLRPLAHLAGRAGLRDLGGQVGNDQRVLLADGASGQIAQHLECRAPIGGELRQRLAASQQLGLERGYLAGQRLTRGDTHPRDPELALEISHPGIELGPLGVEEQDGEVPSATLSRRVNKVDRTRACDSASWALSTERRAPSAGSKSGCRTPR